MSDLYRKEALNKRTRALFGEVRLQAPPGSWLVTILVLLFVGVLTAGLCLIDVETPNGAMRLLDWLLGRGT